MISIARRLLLSVLCLLPCACLWLALPGVALAQDETPTPSKVLYLTFDDGPSGYTQSILDVLARHNARATFFVVGRAAAGHEEFLRAIYAAGHGVANHSYSHASLPALSQARFEAEVARTAAVLGDLDHGCLRPPYGASSKRVRSNAGQMGYQLVMWTIDPRDWTRPGAAAIAERVIQRAHPGGIVVLHDGGGDRTQTVAALESILSRLGEEGYAFAPLCRDGVPLPAPAGSHGFLADAPAMPAAAPILDRNGILSPGAGKNLQGIVAVSAIANHPDFRKWQLDLLLYGTEETFLALGEAPAPEPTELAQWDTRSYPDGCHRLRLRVVRDGLNYDEYFLEVVIANMGKPPEGEEQLSTANSQ